MDTTPRSNAAPPGGAFPLADARLSRRGFLAVAALGVAAAWVPGVARAALPSLDGARRLSLHNLNTGERLSAVYWERGTYLPDALEAIDNVLRDHRTGERCRMAPELIDLVHALSGRVGSSGPVHIISGYRSAATNQMLRSANPTGVAGNSLHLVGQAIDLSFKDRPLHRVRDAALAIGVGGVGYYPQTGFVHLDIGRPRSW